MTTSETHHATEIRDHTEITDFKLQLPTELVNIKPIMEVEVSKTRMVLVYKYAEAVYNSDKPATAWCYEAVPILKKTGAEVQHCRRQTFKHLWELKHWLINYSVELNIKSKQRVTTNRSDED